MSNLISQVCLIGLVGVPLSGKSTLARELFNAKQGMFSIFDVDQTRRELFAVPDAYSRNVEVEQLQASYYVNEARAVECVLSGKSAIVVATYSRDYDYSALHLMHQKCKNASLYIFHLKISDDVARQRIVERNKNPSDSNILTFEQYLEVKSRFYAHPRSGDLVLDASIPMSMLLEQVVNVIGVM